MTIICSLLQVYIICLIIRAVLSWFPPSRSPLMSTVSEFLFSITEPVLGPIRRMIPPLGGFDLSFLILLFGLQILRTAICG
jgi:YggT family protein